MEKKGGYVPSVIISIMIPETSAIGVIPQEEEKRIRIKQKKGSISSPFRR